MNKKMSKRQRDIKSKLMAAIAMLLVSSIMMVSTTYAWFTLSTAPEVTGISTSVGANGNLEMALMPANGPSSTEPDFGITSAVGDALAEDRGNVVKANTTWGNLVDLGSNETAKAAYGLDKITLFPAALNAGTADENGNPASLGAAFLKTPAYGADGRVSQLLENTTTGTYVNGAFPQSDDYGVRTVGTASGMTDRQLAYRNNRGSASTSMAQATTNASTSLNANGNILANIALTHATDDNAVFKQDDVDALLNIVNDLLGTEGNTGVLQHIENAYRSYIVAYAASKISPMTDAQFDLFQAAVSGEPLTEITSLLSDYSVALPEAFSNYINALADTKEKVEEAQHGLNELKSDNEITWDDLDDHLNKLANVEALEINGIAASNVKENMSDLISSVVNDGGMTVTMPTGGGVYADIADHCGDYSASIKVKDVSYGGFTLDEMTARMETATKKNPVYLSAVASAVESAGAPTNEGEGAQVMPVSDHFGYIIDLAFRTNAASSDLLLQTAPADRIYSDNGTDAETMGSGSTMTFKSTTADFTATQMKELMKAIRIVFFNTTDNTVYGTAMLDMDNVKEVGGNEITANIYLYENGAATVEYVPATEGATHIPVPATYKETTNNDAEYYKAADSEDYVKITDESEIPESATKYYVATWKYVEASEGATHKAQTKTGGAILKRDRAEASITALNQNQAKAVSVLVYLDGNNIGNDDVAATAATSMTGSMNLQFASSANLQPMNYTPLMNKNSTSSITATLAEGSTEGVSLTDVAYNAETKTLTFKVSGAEGVTYTVKNGESELTASEDGVYTIENVEASVAVTVTATTTT